MGGGCGDRGREGVANCEVWVGEAVGSLERRAEARLRVGLCPGVLGSHGGM